MEAIKTSSSNNGKGEAIDALRLQIDNLANRLETGLDLIEKTRAELERLETHFVTVLKEYEKLCDEAHALETGAAA